MLSVSVGVNPFISSGFSLYSFSEIPAFFITVETILAIWLKLGLLSGGKTNRPSSSSQFNGFSWVENSDVTFLISVSSLGPVIKSQNTLYFLDNVEYNTTEITNYIIIYQII